MSITSTRRVGTMTVPAIGMGCAPIAEQARELDPAQVEATVHAALDAGVRLFDTARAYCPDGDNGFGERQLAAALASWSGDRDDVVVATKVVSYRAPNGAWLADGSIEAVTNWAHEACRNLRVEHLDLLQAHCVDRAVPWSETVGALFALRDDGVVREVGLSNVTAEELAEALAIGPVASVQNETGADGVDEPVLAACIEHGITYLPYSPFGGPGRAARGLADRHPVLAAVAARCRERGVDVTPHQVCLAWLRALDPVVLPIPAATRPSTITASAAAADVTLEEAEVRLLDDALR